MPKPPLTTPETVRFEVAELKLKVVATVRISGQEIVVVNPAPVVIVAPIVNVSAPVVLEMLFEPENDIVLHCPFAVSLGAKRTVPPKAGIVRVLPEPGTPAGFQFDAVFQSVVVPRHALACAFKVDTDTIKSRTDRITGNFNLSNFIFM